MKSWTFPAGSEKDLQIDRARRLARAKGLTLTGDAITGKFAGSGIEGSYVLSGDVLTAQVKTKPFFQSWDDVHEELRQIFEP